MRRENSGIILVASATLLAATGGMLIGTAAARDRDHDSDRTTSHRTTQHHTTVARHHTTHVPVTTHTKRLHQTVHSNAGHHYGQRTHSNRGHHYGQIAHSTYGSRTVHTRRLTTHATRGRSTGTHRDRDRDHDADDRKVRHRG